MSDEAFEVALEALAQRERTSAELAELLRRRGFEGTAAEEAIGRLIETEAVDDERFAVQYAADKRELRGWGPERIRESLAQRGLDGATIEVALGGEAHADQLERAVELLHDHDRTPSDERGRARAVAWLARRGYASEVAYDAVRAAESRAA